MLRPYCITLRDSWNSDISNCKAGCDFKMKYLDQEVFKCNSLICLDKFMVPNQAFPEGLITHLSEHLPTSLLLLIIYFL